MMGIQTRLIEDGVKMIPIKGLGPKGNTEFVWGGGLDGFEKTIS